MKSFEIVWISNGHVYQQNFEEAHVALREFCKFVEQGVSIALYDWNPGSDGWAKGLWCTYWRSNGPGLENVEVS